MIRTIPLNNNQAHFRFRVNLDGTVVRVRVNWLTRYEYFTVDLSTDEGPLISGRGLHPQVDLLEGTGIGGRLFLEGAEPTPENLNVDNKLRYEVPDA
jgi:hypothetical protein